MLKSAAGKSQRPTIMLEDRTVEDNVKKSIREFIVDDVLEGQDIGELTDSTPLITTSILDSIAVLKLVLFLEEKFSVSIDPADIDAEHLDTIELIAELVRSSVDLETS